MREDLAKMVRETESLRAELLEIRKRIHREPELSGAEFQTRDLIVAELGKLGIETQTFEDNCGVIGLIRGALPGKTIGVRADMDALPLQETSGEEFASRKENIAHACGHDVHTTVLLGCAKVLSKFKGQLRGNVKLIFQPAEEIMKGAQALLGSGLLTTEPRLDKIIGLHTWPELPVGTVGVKSGSFMASSDFFKLTVQGRAGHAAHPHKSVDAVVIAAQVITALQTIISRETAPLDSAVITIGKISGGSAPNIIAGQVELDGTIRTLTSETRAEIPQRMEQLAQMIAQGMNGNAEYEYILGTPPLINGEETVALVRAAAEEVLGTEKVHQLAIASMGGEDFAFYLEHIPGAMFRLGTANDNPQSKLALHNPRIVFDNGALEVGVKVMCASVINYLREAAQG